MKVFTLSMKLPASKFAVPHLSANNAQFIYTAEASSFLGLTPVRKGDTVLLCTGHYDRTYPKKEYLTENPGLDHDGTVWLAERGVVNIGIDASTIDSCGNTINKFFPAHQVCAEYAVMNTENLCNLGKVSGKRFTYVGLPLKIRGGTGSPIRAVALLDQ